MKFSSEQIKKAKEAKTAEELSALAKENGTELTEAQSEAFFAFLSKEKELSDSELEAIAGGKGEETVHPEPKYKAGECYWLNFYETWGTILSVYWNENFNEWTYTIQLAQRFRPGVDYFRPLGEIKEVERRESVLSKDISGSAPS